MNIDSIMYRLRLVFDYYEMSVFQEKVGGFLFDIQGYALMTLAEQGPGVGEIVELGSFKGKSTCWLARGTKRVRREKVTAIDQFTGSPEHQKGMRHEDADIAESGSTYSVFRENLKKLEVDDYVVPLVASSEEAARNWDKPIRLLFIDADHSYEASKLDFELWSPFVVDGGLIAFHDIGSWPGVTQFYQEMLSAGAGYKQAFEVMGLAVVEKVTQQPEP
jgi:predicted O-methyltransferase YrrM